MFVYAGIDEAGYGPLFGPLVVGRCVLVIPKLPADSDPPHLWQRLNQSVGRTLKDRRHRIVVNDSKKLTTKAAGIKHLETGCLAFAGLGGHEPQDVGAWLDLIGATRHRTADLPPWYAVSNTAPWQALPAAGTGGEIAIARKMLRTTCERIGVGLGSLGAHVVYEDQFNQQVAMTRSKAAVNFTRVAAHLDHIWQTHGQHHPTVAVDRQGGRTAYRELLATTFPGAALSVEEETPQRSAYTLRAADRAMAVSFQVQAEQDHMPTALASMVAKYTRELLMARLNAWFTRHCPDIAPTKGYGTDGKRFWEQIRPTLAGLKVDPGTLKRRA